MAWHDFVRQLQTIKQKRQTDLVLKLNPRVALLPHPIQRYDDPFLPFGKAVIQATQDLVCAYLFDLAGYLSIGAAGAVALERTVAYLSGETPTILHAPFVGQAYSAMADSTGFGVDAITVIYDEDLRFYLQNPPFAAFKIGDPSLPTPGGYYWTSANKVGFWDEQAAMVTMRVVGDDVLYADGTNDFADTLLQRVERMRQNDENNR